MVPWPIGLLALFYGVIATSAAATAWRIMQGVTHQVLAVQAAWFGVSAGAMIGLALLKSWGRTLAVWTSVLLMVTMLAIAGLLALAAGQALGGLLVAAGAGLHMLAIRYLQRPTVKALFATTQSG